MKSTVLASILCAALLVCAVTGTNLIESEKNMSWKTGEKITEERMNAFGNFRLEAFRAELAAEARRRIVAVAYAPEGVTRRHYFLTSTIRARNGDLLCFFRAASAHISADGRIALCRSTDNGMTWSSPEIVWEHPTYDVRNEAAGMALNGDIILAALYYDVVTGPVGVYVRRSSDYGVTWTVPALIAAPLTDFWSPHEKIQNFGGILWMQAYGANTGETERAILMRSNDHGVTWFLGATVAYDATNTVDYNEVAIVRPANVYGPAIAIIRNEIAGNPLAIARSWDACNTWGQLEPFAARCKDVAGGISPALIEVDNLFVLAINCDSYTYGNQLVLLVSDDFGETWSGIKELSTKNVRASYPSLENLEDGRIICTYDRYMTMGSLMPPIVAVDGILAQIIDVEDLKPQRPPVTKYFIDDDGTTLWNARVAAVNDETEPVSVHGYNRKTLHFVSTVAGTLTIYEREPDGNWQVHSTVAIDNTSSNPTLLTDDIIQIKLAFNQIATVTAWYSLQK